MVTLVVPEELSVSLIPATDPAPVVLDDKSIKTLLPEEPVLYAIEPLVSPTLEEDSERMFKLSIDAPAVEESPV
jgi:hypothetical protein